MKNNVKLVSVQTTSRRCHTSETLSFNKESLENALGQLSLNTLTSSQIVERKLTGQVVRSKHLIRQG